MRIPHIALIVAGFTTVFATVFATACKNQVFTRTKSDVTAPAAQPGAPDPATVPADLQDYVMKWSTKAECVVTEPQPSQELDKFRCNRTGNWARFCEIFDDMGRGASGVVGMCKNSEFLFGSADGNTCEYGHCGEASAVFGCQAVMRAVPLDRIQICQTDNDHIFAMIQQQSGSYCILDRWTVPFTKETPTARGAILCDVQIMNGRVTVAGKPSGNPWYADLSCKPVVEHYEERCPPPSVLSAPQAPLSPSFPEPQPDDPTR